MRVVRVPDLVVWARMSGVSGVDNAGRWEDEWVAGDECSNSGEVDGMGKGDAGRREDGWGDGDVTPQIIP